MTNDERTQTWANGMMRLAFPDLAYSYVEFPLDLDPVWVLGQMNAAMEAMRATFPPPDVEAPAGPRVGIQAMARPSSNVPQREAQYVPSYMSETCDQCGGPVKFRDGFTSRAGKPISPSLECAASCKDGKFQHNVRWLDKAELQRA